MKGAGRLFLAAFGVRLLCGLALGSFHHPEVWEFEGIANSLLAGQGFVRHHMGAPYHAYVLPVYPLFCAGLYALTGHSQVVVLLIQCLIGAFAAVQVKAIGNLVFQDPKIAILGAWLTAFHPPLILFATRLHSLTLDLFALLWTLWAWLRLVRSPRLPESLHAGLAGGFALLSRGTAVAFLAWAAAVAGWVLRRRPRKILRVLGLVVLVSGAIVAPWLVRNARVLHHFPVLITTDGQSLWQGNNLQASGSAYLADGRTGLETLPPRLMRRLPELDELGQRRLFQEEAGRCIREHPLHAFKLYLTKLKLFWWAGPQTGLKYPRSYLLTYLTYYTGVLVLAGMGLWRWRFRLVNPAGMLLIGFPVSVSLLQSMYYVEGRHRWGVEPVLLLLAAAGWMECLNRGREPHAIA